jgi:hypothetical protein
VIEEDVSVAHSVLCTAALLKRLFIGIGAIVLDGATVGEGALVAVGLWCARLRSAALHSFRRSSGKLFATHSKEIERSKTPTNYMKYVATYRELLGNKYITFSNKRGCLVEKAALYIYKHLFAIKIICFVFAMRCPKCSYASLVAVLPRGVR